MKQFFIIFALLFATSAIAQPPARRAQQVEKQKTQQKAVRQGSAYRDFPTASAVQPTDAAWKRELYRSLDLTREANAPLYFPSTPQRGQQNLFSFLFKLVLRKQIKAYDTNFEAVEDFSENNVISPQKLMEKFEIPYEEKDGRLRVLDADIPSDRVMLYYIKETTYYNQQTSTFHTAVTALCPVKKVQAIDDDYFDLGEFSNAPMFWVKMEDIAPFLGQFMLMGSDKNNAALLSADDFFTLNRYEGDIFRTVNLQDRILSQYCKDEAQLAAEQKRIEGELHGVYDGLYGRDSFYVAQGLIDEAADSTTARAKDDVRVEQLKEYAAKKNVDLSKSTRPAEVVAQLRPEPLDSAAQEAEAAAKVKRAPTTRRPATPTRRVTSATATIKPVSAATKPKNTTTKSKTSTAKPKPTKSRPPKGTGSMSVRKERH